MYYPVAIHKDPDSDYGVSVPDLPGCFSAGATMDEVIDAAKEAILCHIEGIFTDDEGLPSSQSIENHRENELYADAVAWAIVDVDISALAGTTKRVNITMPEGVLSRIGEVSDNRSRFLTEAAVGKLSRQTRA